MKKIIYISILSVLFFTCNREDEKVNANGQHLKIDEVKNYLPQAYFQETSLIYVNNTGLEKELNITVIENDIQREHNNFNYTTDNFELTLFDPENIQFQIVLLGSTNLSSDNIAVTSLNAMLMPLNQSGNTWMRIYFEENLPIVSMFDDFNESITLINKEFNKVYIAKGKNNLQEEYESYSELSINSEIGVVAFKDENNELWRFDRFKE